MAEQREVQFKLTVQSGQGPQAVDRLTQSARAASKAFEDAERAAARMSQAAAGGGGSGIGKLVGIGAANQANPAAGFGVPGFGALFGLGVLARTMGALGNAMQQASEQSRNFEEHIEILTKGFVKNIPIIGQAFQFLGDALDSVAGVAANRAAVARQAATSAARIRSGSAEFGVQLGAAGQLADLSRTGDASSIEAQAARGFASSFGGFTSRTEFGVATGQRGELQFGEAQASSEAVAAQAVAAKARQRFGDREAELGLPGIRRSISVGEREERRIRGRLAQLNAPNAGRSLQPIREAQADTDTAALETTTNRLMADRERLAKSLTELGRERAQLSLAEQNSAQKQYELAQARVALLKDESALAQERLGGAKGLAQALGGMAPGAGEAIADLVEQVNRDPSLLRNPQVASIMGTLGPAGAKRVQEGGEALGAAEPSFARNQAALGNIGTGGLAGAQQQADDLAVRVQQAQANANATLKESLAQVIASSNTDIAKIIAEVLKAQVDNLKTALLQELAKQGLLGGSSVPKALQAQPVQ